MATFDNPAQRTARQALRTATAAAVVAVAAAVAATVGIASDTDTGPHTPATATPAAASHPVPMRAWVTLDGMPFWVGPSGQLTSAGQP